MKKRKPSSARQLPSRPTLHRLGLFLAGISFSASIVGGMYFVWSMAHYGFAKFWLQEDVMLAFLTAVSGIMLATPAFKVIDLGENCEELFEDEARKLPDLSTVKKRLQHFFGDTSLDFAGGWALCMILSIGLFFMLTEGKTGSVEVLRANFLSSMWVLGVGILLVLASLALTGYYVRGIRTMLHAGK